MRALLFVVTLTVLLGTPVFAQSKTEENLRRVVPYSEVLSQFPGLTLSDYNRVVRQVAQEIDDQPKVTPSLPIDEPPTLGSSYDSRFGNTYWWRREPDGSMRGFDSGMDLWNYDAGSGTYMNLGTGAICVGTGPGRSCTL